MPNPFPFSTGQVLTAANMNNIGDHVPYTVTISNFVLGNGASYASYAEVNEIVHYVGYCDLGTTSVMTGPLDISLPVTADTTYQPVLAPYAGQCMFYNGAGLIYGVPIALFGGTSRLTIIGTAGAYAANADVGAAIPFTWASTSFFYWNFVYRK